MADNEIQNDSDVLASLRQHLYEPGPEPKSRPQRAARARLMRVKIDDLAEFLKANPTYRVMGL